ncbi:MAG: nucleotidyltransferase family protein [Burkholderiales bacterium]|nr:nucleotidyltransferase family protein [Burkholderiales bacterium]MDE2395266.1 nucleotidyltransferase family protein [Burkholderiales bacterium]MDE2457292.1 nucleotidyltransferase family protein [Burkholderiales bacterium]
MRFAPTIIVLAAGRGSRFKASGHKLEQPLGGSTVLATTLHHAIETRLPVAVVTTAALVPQVADQIALRDIIVVSDAQAARGMGHSIATGVGERADAPGWLILPGDMPLVRPETMAAVAAALEGHAVAFPQLRGRRGHPVGFSAELYAELVTLDGDEGARRLVARYPAFTVEVSDPGVLVDIDTPADLDAVRGPVA